MATMNTVSAVSRPLLSDCLSQALHICREDQQTTYISQQANLMSSLSVATPPPPVDEVTTCSDEDDGSSVSSVSSAEDDAHDQRERRHHRPIFADYWDHKCEHHSLKRPLSRALFSPSTADEISYERTLAAVQDDTRRQIFSEKCYSQSMPSLHDRNAANFRKTKSTSALSPPSCLRHRDSPKAPHHSVSFHEQVKVTVFEPPSEIWAPAGWSNWFSG